MEGWVQKKGSFFSWHWRYAEVKLDDEPTISFFSDEGKQKLRSQCLILDAKDGGTDRPIQKPTRYLIDVTLRKVQATNTNYVQLGTSTKDEQTKWLRSLSNLEEQVSNVSNKLESVASKTKSMLSFDSLNFGDKIGQGAQGSVFKGSWGGIEVAIKQVQLPSDLSPENEQALVSEMETEVEALTTLQHPCIERFYGVAVNDHSVYLVTDIYPMSLLDLLKKPEVLNNWEKPDVFLTVAVDMARGLAFMHAQHTMHRDIKPGNIFIAEEELSSSNSAAAAAVSDADKEFHAKLGDFGLAKVQMAMRCAAACVCEM